MGENETIEVKAPAAPAAAPLEKLVAKTPTTKDKKKDKKLVLNPEGVPHLTGRLLNVEVGSSGVEFAIKGKKGKAESFNLKGMDASAVPGAAAMLATLLESKTKLRVEFTTSGDTRTVSKLRAHN
jgi:hypothetical protein